MKAMTPPLLAACLALLLLALTSQAVYVQDGGYKVPLETVKELKSLLPSEIRSRTVAYFCAHPLLPKEAASICRDRDAPQIFRRLMIAVSDPDLCELCAQAACAGCR
ncbi:guanylate cyclase activator 2B-like [Rhinatrema bivittatum]|uniref:guanylate cyclase activator 2B-like n=1 Tax=Rhinatrema bivittatum TaxID=194408 RepID=UPI00112BDCD5|nr:guanylate cyclase activator 2B-like [Rhinatrema bivittatum]